MRWRGDGKELFYVSTDDRLVALPIALSSDGTSVDFGSPTPLFQTNMLHETVNTFKPQYVVSRDGRFFVLQSIVGDADASPISIVLNWKQK